MTNDYTDFQTFTQYGIFDADQHLNEGSDAYTRHIDPKFRDRTLSFSAEGGRGYLSVDGRRIPRDMKPGKVPRPGSLKDLLKSLKAGAGSDAEYQWLDPDPAFSDPAARLEMLDKQNVDACFLYSNSIGLLAEHLVVDDDLYYASSWAYLRYLDEEWGFARADRMFVAPVFSFRDPQRTAEQLDWFYERGGRIVSFVPGPAHDRNPADPYFDPIWSRIDAANGLVVYHINESIPDYKAARSAAWGEDERPSFYTQSAWQWFWAYGEVPALETFSALIYGNLFERFPNITVISAEHGCEWIPTFVRKLDKMRGMGRNGRWIGGPLPERPSAIFAQHFRVVPFWEDDISSVVEKIGYGVLLGGSDFPHAEGLAFPTQLVEHLSTLDADAQRFVMRDSALQMLG